MRQHHDKFFPNESGEYREARDKLLEAEQALRRQVEDVAELRRQLPLGGVAAEDYVFEEGPPDLDDNGAVRKTKLSELFDEGKDSLVIYSFMYAPSDEMPCPMCTSIADGFNGSAPHIRDRVNFALVAKVPIKTLRSWAASRGWSNLRLLSSSGNGYNVDYLAEDAEGAQWPMINVFRKTGDGVFHSWGSELFYAKSDVGHARHADMVWPVWNMFDLTPDGRGSDWFPKFSYD